MSFFGDIGTCVSLPHKRVTIDALLSGRVDASARYHERGAPNGDLDELAPASGRGYVTAAARDSQWKRNCEVTRRQYSA